VTRVVAGALQATMIGGDEIRWCKTIRSRGRGRVCRRRHRDHRRPSCAESDRTHRRRPLSGLGVGTEAQPDGLRIRGMLRPGPSSAIVTTASRWPRWRRARRRIHGGRRSAGRVVSSSSRTSLRLPDVG
jgi:hypothetical protein